MPCCLLAVEAGDSRLAVPRINGFIIPFKADAFKAALRVRIIGGDTLPSAAF